MRARWKHVNRQRKLVSAEPATAHISLSLICRDLARRLGFRSAIHHNADMGDGASLAAASRVSPAR